MNSGKSIFLELLKVAGTVVITLVITAWFSGPSDIEYKTKSINSYFNMPNALEDKLKIINGNTEIENISVVNFGLYNRGFSDYEKVKIHIEIQDDKSAKLLSSNLLPPERLTTDGIAKLTDSNNQLSGYSIDVFKTSVDDDYYLIHLIFEGDEAPEVKIKTSTKNIEIIEYKEWKDLVWLVFIVFLGYTAILGPIAILGHYSTKRSKSRYLTTLKRRWAENDQLSKDQVDFVAQVFVEERDRKTQGIFTKIKNKITATE